MPKLDYLFLIHPVWLDMAQFRKKVGLISTKYLLLAYRLFKGFQFFPLVGTQETKNTVVVAPSTNIATTPQVVTTTVQEISNVRTLTMTAPPRKYTNTVLEVKKLPPSLNNIATLNGYFQRFGKIVNIQVSAFSICSLNSVVSTIYTILLCFGVVVIFLRIIMIRT